MTKNTQAIVVGMCAHGLALVRALADAEISVLAIESNRHLPGVRTNKARVVIFDDINGAGLAPGLVRLARNRDFRRRPVLFVTNDRMVRRISANWNILEPYYRLSWGDCTDQVARYLDKRQIESRCETTGIAYPRTVVFESVDQNAKMLRFPAVVKPANPLGPFKAVIAENLSQLQDTLQRYAKSLPFIVQDWVSGPDSNLLVCALVLEEGAVKARFDGRKLASFPAGTGQTSIMEYCRNDAVYEIAKSIFRGLGIDGPVSIEVKKADNGELFLIEPTVGRTDYFLDAITRNGVNFPACEYDAVTGTRSVGSSAIDKCVWFDTERDRTSFLRQFRSLRKSGRIRKPIFSYFRTDDIRPFLSGVRRDVPAVARSIMRRLMRRR